MIHNHKTVILGVTIEIKISGDVDVEVQKIAAMVLARVSDVGKQLIPIEKVGGCKGCGGGYGGN